MTAEQLLKRRTRIDMSQMTLARKAGVSRYNISLFECGFRKLNETEETAIKNTLEREENRGVKNRKIRS